MNLTGANQLTGESHINFDGHAHVFESNLVMAPERRYTPGYDATIESYSKLLTEHDLGGAILVQPSFLGTDNSYLLSAIKRSKQISDLRFYGVVVVDPSFNANQLLEFNENNIIGIRLNLVNRPLLNDQDISAWRPLFEYINSLGWHLELHCEGSRLIQILPKLLKFCDRIVIDHFGLPCSNSETICQGQQLILNSPKEHIFIKVSAPYRVHCSVDTNTAATQCKKYFIALLDYLGPTHLLWGSDWPWTQFENKHDYHAVNAWLDTWLE